MNKEIVKKAGFTKEVALVEKGQCPFCRKIVFEDSLRDELSKKEFRISGLCQECQDNTFGR